MIVMLACAWLPAAWAGTSLEDAQQAWSLYERARALEAEGNLSQAEALYRQALELAAQDGELVVDKYRDLHVLRGRTIRRSRREEVVVTRPYYPNAALARIRQQRQQAQVLAERHLKDLDPPELVQRVSLLPVNSTSGRPEAGGEVRLLMDVINQGGSDADEVAWQVSADFLASPLSGVWDHIPAGDTRSVEQIIRLPRNLSGDVTLRVTLQERDGFNPAPMVATLPVQSWQPPRLELKTVTSELVADVRSVFRVVVRNVDSRAAEDLRLVIPASDALGLDQPIEHLRKTLGPGDEWVVSLPLLVRSGHESVGIRTRLEQGGLVLAERRMMLAVRPRAEVRFVATGGAVTTAEAPVIASGVDLALRPSRRHRPQDAALLIGNGRYDRLGAPVAYAAADVSLMAEVMARRLGLQNDNIWVRRDLTRADMDQLFGNGARYGTLSHYLKNLGQVDTLYVYYTGHGIPLQNEGGAPALLAVDAREDNYAAASYRLDDLYGQLARLPVRQVVVLLDTCFSGRSDTLEGGQPRALFTQVSGTLWRVNEQVSLPAERLVVLTAASGDEFSQWLPDVRHGAFTAVLAETLARAPADGPLAVAEIHGQVLRRLTQLTAKLQKRPQTPQLLGNARARIGGGG